MYNIRCVLSISSVSPIIIYKSMWTAHQETGAGEYSVTYDAYIVQSNYQI